MLLPPLNLVGHAWAIDSFASHKTPLKNVRLLSLQFFKLLLSFVVGKDEERGTAAAAASAADSAAAAAVRTTLAAAAKVQKIPNQIPENCLFLSLFPLLSLSLSLF